MGIIFVFFVICTIVLVADHNSNQSSSLQVYLPFYISGIVLISLLAFFEAIHPYYIAGMILMPIPNIIAVSIILNLWDALVKVSPSPVPSITPNHVTIVSTPDTPLIQINIVLDKAKEWQKISTSLKREYQHLRTVNFQKDDHAQNHQLQYDNHIKDIKSLQAQVRHCDAVQIQYEAELEQLICISPKHYPEFDQIATILHNTLNSLKSLEKNLADWLTILQRQKNTTTQESQWNAYQQKAKAFVEQKQQVIATQKAYRQTKEQFQTLTQSLGKANGLNTQQPMPVDSLETHLKLQQNALILDKFQDLQAQALDLKQRLVKEKQALQLQDNEVNEQWLAYQKLPGEKSSSIGLSIWTSYDVQNEEAFWKHYEQVVKQMKHSRITIIQKAG